MENFLDAPVPVNRIVFEDIEVNSVNLRDVYFWLESKQEFTTWAKSRTTDFSEGVDYFVDKKINKDNNMIIQIDYIVSIDVAKNAAMMERNEKGRLFRKYFLDTERKYYALLESIAEKSTLLEDRTKELQQERNELIARLHKSTHNRISSYEVNVEGGKVLTQKDRRLVGIEEKYTAQYILACCNMSAAIHRINAFSIVLPDEIVLKDGRILKTIYRETAAVEKITKEELQSIFADESYSLFDFC
jgi:phage anti-repressor protein